MAGGKLWTSEEDAMLREHYPMKGSRETGALLGRAVASVRSRAHKLGIVWTPSLCRATKICTACHTEKERDAFRLRRRGATTYLNATCLSCDATAQLLRPAEVKRAAVQRWRVANPGAVKAADRKQRERRKEKRKQEYRAWYERNRDLVIAAQNARRLADPEKYNAKVRERYARDPGPFKTEYHRRRARLAGVKATLTREQWRSIVELFDHRCAYCGGGFERLTQDHVLPISRGGEHTLENVVPACRPCNSSKRTRTPAEWTAAKKRSSMAT